jgi:hypothetical protein
MDTLRIPSSVMSGEFLGQLVGSELKDYSVE